MTPGDIDKAANLLRERADLKTALLNLSGGCLGDVRTLPNRDHVYPFDSCKVSADMLRPAIEAQLVRNTAGLKALGVEP